MINYIYDDGGRANAGYKGDAGDCQVRAISIITGYPYKRVYDTIAKTFKKNGYAKTANAERIGKAKVGLNTPRLIQDMIFKDFGFTKVKLGRGTKPTYTEAEEEFGSCIVTTTKHFAALKEGSLRDTFDGRIYAWKEDGQEVIKQRKARSIWLPNSD